MTKQFSTSEGVFSGANELSDLVFDGTFETSHKDLRDLLFDRIFDHKAGMSLSESGRLSYERSRHIHKNTESPLSILTNPQRLFAIAEWSSVMDVSVFSILMVHYNLCMGTLFDHASDREDLKREVKELDSLDSFGPYMATELGFGNNVAALQTEAIYDHDQKCMILNTPADDALKFMSYSGFSDIPKMAVVLARLIVKNKDRGVFPLLVQISDEHGLCDGVSAMPCPEKPVQGLDNGLTRFTNKKLPLKSLLLGDIAKITVDGEFIATTKNPRKRFLRSMSRIIPGRLCVSSAALGAGKAAIYLATKYSQNRLTNAPGGNDMPIIKYRVHQRAIFCGLAHLYAMIFLVNFAKRKFLAANGESSTELNVIISISKAMSTWEVSDIIAMCRERCGAQGIFSSNRIADYGSLLQGLVTAEGDNLVLMSTAAGQHAAFHDENKKSLAPDPCDKSLFDLNWLSDVLKFLADEQLSDFHRKKRTCSDQDFFSIMNTVAGRSLDMMRAHGIQLSYCSMTAAIADVKSAELKALLETIARIYALNSIQKYSALLLAKSAMTPEQVLALPDAIDDLCSAIAPHSEQLVEGFGLSPELLRAPIGHKDYISAFINQSQFEHQNAPKPRSFELHEAANNKHIYECPLRWADMDAYGVVNNVVYFRLFEQARVDFIWGMGPNGDDAFFSNGSVVVDQDIKYINPLVYCHKPVTIEIWVSELMAATVTMTTRVLDGKTVCAIGKTTMAPFNYEKRKPRRLTSAEVEFFKSYLATE